ncbi:MAG: hypothetical protein NTU53_14160 [Planctomycetota bacterium]|nr:hypothetical protein [Planctomycetota bacterium]
MPDVTELKRFKNLVQGYIDQLRAADPDGGIMFVASDEDERAWGRDERGALLIPPGVEAAWHQHQVRMMLPPLLSWITKADDGLLMEESRTQPPAEPKAAALPANATGEADHIDNDISPEQFSEITGQNVKHIRRQHKEGRLQLTLVAALEIKRQRAADVNENQRTDKAVEAAATGKAMRKCTEPTCGWEGTLPLDEIFCPADGCGAMTKLMTGNRCADGATKAAAV